MEITKRFTDEMEKDVDIIVWCVLCDLILYSNEEYNSITRNVANTISTDHVRAFSEPHQVVITSPEVKQ